MKPSKFRKKAIAVLKNSPIYSAIRLQILREATDEYKKNYAELNGDEKPKPEMVSNFILCTKDAINKKTDDVIASLIEKCITNSDEVYFLKHFGMIGVLLVPPLYVCIKFFLICWRFVMHDIVALDNNIVGWADLVASSAAAMLIFALIAVGLWRELSKG